MRAHEGDQRLGPRLQVAPVRIGLGAMAQQHEAFALPFVQVQRQVGDEGKAAVVGGDQAGEGMARISSAASAGSSDLNCGGWYMARLCRCGTGSGGRSDAPGSLGRNRECGSARSAQAPAAGVWTQGSQGRTSQPQCGAAFGRLRTRRRVGSRAVGRRRHGAGAAPASGSHRANGPRSCMSSMYQRFFAPSQRAPSDLASSFSANGAIQVGAHGFTPTRSSPAACCEMS